MSEEKYRAEAEGSELDQMIGEAGLDDHHQLLLPGSTLLQPPLPAPPQPATAARSAAQGSWLWNDTPENETKLRGLFAMISRSEEGDDLPDAVTAAADASATAVSRPDNDGNGGISSTELMHMLVNLGEDVAPDLADDMVQLIDSDGSHEIEFSEFYGVLTGRIPLDGSASAPQTTQLGKSLSIREIRKQFDMVDEDGGGYLDRDEVAVLGEKMGQLQRRHLVDAMAAMDPANTGQVTFDMFKNWVIDSKDGRKWYDFLVLPESAIFAMQRKAAEDDLLPPAGSAAGEWMRLSILMKLLDQATLLWGLPTDMYGVKQEKLMAFKEGKPGELNPDELEKEAMAMRFFLHPNMPFRSAWDIAQVILLLYLLIIVPLRVAFDAEVKFGSTAFWFDVFVDIYFIADIFLNFRTAYFDKRGVIVISQKMIARNYLKSWFVIDFITCLPISYIMMIARGPESAGDGKEVRAAKILRLLKLGKLLRVARLVRIIERYQDYLRVVWNIMGGWILSIAIFFLSHTIACLWYYIGTLNQESYCTSGEDGQPQCTAPGQGWVEQYFEECESQQPPPPAPSPTDTAEVTCLVPDRTTRYVTSVYWALTTVSTVGYGDISAHTDIEKVAAAMTMLFGAVVFAGITGQMASRFMASKGALQHFNTRMDQIRQYLMDKSIPTPQRRAIEAHFALLWGRAAIYNEAEILSLLPRTLRDPVVEALYIPLLSHVAAFSALGRNTRGREVLALISAELTSTVSMPRNIVMLEGDYGHEMFFIQEGEVEIYQHNSSTTATRNVVHSDFRSGLGVRLGRLGTGSFFGERAILARGNGWGNGVRSRTAVSRKACRFYILHKSSVDKIRQQIPPLHKHMLEVEKGLDGKKEEGLEDGEWSSGGEIGALKAQLDRLEAATQARHTALEAKLDNLMSLVERRVA